MAYLKVVLVVVSACLVYCQCVPMDVLLEDKSFKVQVYYNSSTTVYKGADWSTPVAIAKLEVVVFTQKPHRFSELLQTKIPSLPDVTQMALSHVDDDVEGKHLPLVFQYNKTDVVNILGPRQPSSVVKALELNLFAKKN